MLKLTRDVVHRARPLRKHNAKVYRERQRRRSLDDANANWIRLSTKFVSCIEIRFVLAFYLFIKRPLQVPALLPSIGYVFLRTREKRCMRVPARRETDVRKIVAAF